MSDKTTVSSRLYPTTKNVLRERKAKNLVPPYVSTEAGLADFYINLGIRAQDAEIAREQATSSSIMEKSV